MRITPRRRPPALSDPRARSRALRRFAPHYDPEAFGRFSETIARYLGTARYLVIQTGIIMVWIVLNVVLPDMYSWDEYPYILLTLALSMQASYAAPLILLAQNRQAERDRYDADEDRRRSARTVADTEFLAREVASIRLAQADAVTRDYLRGELSRLTDELTKLRKTLEPSNPEPKPGRES